MCQKYWWKFSWSGITKVCRPAHGGGGAAVSVQRCFVPRTSTRLITKFAPFGAKIVEQASGLAQWGKNSGASGGKFGRVSDAAGCGGASVPGFSHPGLLSARRSAA
jgi:hypothetical protein